MSTSEDVPLYPLDCVKEKEDSNHARLTEPLEHDDTDNKQGTIPGAKGSLSAPATTNRWKTLMTAATTLLAYVFLNAGISMIVPFYSIEVSCIMCTSNYSLLNPQTLYILRRKESSEIWPICLSKLQANSSYRACKRSL